MPTTVIDLTVGKSAFDLLDDPRFKDSWRSLFSRCSHATAFQAPEFVCPWYQTYRDEWEPVILRSSTTSGELSGLWLLARNVASNVLVHAGAHQAEYHVWLAAPGQDAAFVESAWDTLRQKLSVTQLRFKYLPDVALAEILQTHPAFKGRVSVRVHSRPLLRLDPADVKASFAKKSNKSRFNRVRKLGKFEFRRIREQRELEEVFDDLIACYDLRQGGVNSSTPFRDDARKRAFYSSYFAAAGNDIYVTVSYIDGRPIAAFWGSVTGQTAHLGMLIHSPMLAEHSPGKLHVMQLSEHLLSEDKHVLDLTPGGDAWKERFANAHDEVAEVLIYGSAVSKRWDDERERSMQWVKGILARVGVTPADTRSALAALRKVPKSNPVRVAKDWAASAAEERIYCADRADLAVVASCTLDERVRRNSLSDLLTYDPKGSALTRTEFFSDALSRLERGEAAYTTVVNGRLVQLAWLASSVDTHWLAQLRPPANIAEGSVAFECLYSHPDHGTGSDLHSAVLRRMLFDTFADEGVQFAYVLVNTFDSDACQMVEKIGFKHLGSRFAERRFGVHRNWVSVIGAQSEAADA